MLFSLYDMHREHFLLINLYIWKKIITRDKLAYVGCGNIKLMYIEIINCIYTQRNPSFQIVYTLLGSFQSIQSKHLSLDQSIQSVSPVIRTKMKDIQRRGGCRTNILDLKKFKSCFSCPTPYWWVKSVWYFTF